MAVCWCPLCGAEAFFREQERLRELYVRENPQSDDLKLAGYYLNDLIGMIDAGKPKEARAALLDFLRGQRARAFDIIADMIDPAGKSYWKLDLKQRDKGTPRQVTSDKMTLIAFHYEGRLQRLRGEGRASPAKIARGELAKKYNMTDEQIRAIIKRAPGRWRQTRR